MNHSEIKTVLPHRFPMIMVDAVRELDLENTRIVAVKAVTASDFCYGDLEDGAGAPEHAYPLSLVIESFCQAAGILCNRLRGEIPGRKLMLFGSMGDLTVYGDAFPGDVLEHRAHLVKDLSDAAVFAGEVHVGGRAILKVGQVVVALRPATALDE